MHSMKHNSIGTYACPKHKHDTIQENKHKEKQTKQGFLINSMFSPPWYMHLPYGISLLLFVRKTNGQGEKRARDEGTNNDNDA